MVDSIVIVSEPHHVKYLENVDLNGIKVIAVSKNIERLLNIPFENVDFPQNIQEKYIEWMKQLPYVAKKNGVNMFKKLSYDGFSFWWLMENWLFRGDGHFDSIFDVLNSVHIVDNIIKEHNPDKVIFVDDGKLYSNVIKHVADVSLEPISASKAFSMKKKIVDIASKHFWTYSFYRRKLDSGKFDKYVDSGVDALFIRGIAWERMYDYETNKMCFREPFTDELKQRLNGLSVGMQIGSNLNLKNMKTCSGKCVLFENYWDSDAKEEQRNIIKKVYEGFEELLKNEDFKKSFDFEGNDLWPLIEKQFRRYFNVRLYSHARTYSMVSQMIDKEKPKVVVTPEEVSETARIVFANCIKRKIPCIAIQHGIFDTNLLCYHSKDEISFDKTDAELCPIPTKTCVYGSHYKDILVKNGHYPSANVVVTGVQRFDRIFNQKFNKESFHRRYAIPFNKRIISYVTSPTSFNEEMTLALLKAVKKVPNSIVVIKHHPSESGKFYENIVEDADSDAIVLSDSDLYDVLNASDVVLTYLSTAGLEAMIFNKPVGILNLTGEEDRITYAKQGAAIGIYKKEDIVEIINDLLSKGSLYRKIQHRAKSFVKQNVFKPDGKATDRIENVIKKLMK